MNRAFVFPGQGSQHIGMGKDLFDNFITAKRTFEEVDDALHQKLSKLIFSGLEEELAVTAYTQPALMTVSIAIIRIIQSELKAEINELCKLVAGHSLGQYTALCAVESMSLATTAKLLKARGEAMQNAVPLGIGGMVAVLGADTAQVNEVLTQVNSIGVCELANDNSNQQKVISGHSEAIERAIILFKGIGIKAVRLKVSAPFHCSLMNPAAEEMREIITNTEMHTPKLPILDNTSAKKVVDPLLIKQLLIKQIPSTIRWRETTDIITSEFSQVIEMGAGRVLTSLFKRSYPDFNAINCSNIEDLTNIINLLAEEIS